MDAPGHVAANLFDLSDDISSRALGVPGFLILALDVNAEKHPLETVEPGSQRRFADSVAVAAVNGVAAAHRRAVVLVVDCTFDLEHDSSSAEPAAVRRYLESIGVPLFGWSVSGPRPDLETEWGDIDDVSNPNRLRLAVERLRSTLASQRVVWISSDPLPRYASTPIRDAASRLWPTSAADTDSSSFAIVT